MKGSCAPVRSADVGHRDDIACSNSDACRANFNTARALPGNTQRSLPMHVMPFLLENHRFAIMVTAQILVLALELRAPAVTLRTGRWRHTARNLMITVPWVATFMSA